jgi:hypothetical protein
MNTKRPLRLGLACCVILAMPLMACDENPSRFATGEEIGEAVKNAEVQMAEARAKRLAETNDGAFAADKVLAARDSER